MVYDNPLILEHDPDYVHRLESEPNEVLRRAYLDGDWSVFAGQFFSEFSVSTHVLPLDWQPEKHWQAFWSHDPGHWHPAVWLLFVTDERGGVYVLRELVEREMYPEEQSKVIHSWPESIRIQHNTAIGGADCWARGRDGGPTLAEQFSLMDPENRRVYLVKANTDRVQGARQVRDYLRVTEKGPRLMIHPRCKQLIACLPRLVHDPHRPEDVLKVDSTDTDPYCGDDTYDCLRYFLMSRPIQSKQDPDAPFVPYTYDDRVRMYVKKRRERLAKQSRLMSKGVDSVLGKKW